jgi:hypothetical protein
MKTSIKLIFLLILSLSLTSCVSNSGGIYYEVSAKTSEGQKVKIDNDVKYYAQKYFAIMLEDFYEGDGDFIAKSNSEYKYLNKEYSIKIGFKANYTV